MAASARARSIRDISVRIASSTTEVVSAALRDRKPIARARRLYWLGQGAHTIYGRAPKSAWVATGCYRRAWRELDRTRLPSSHGGATVPAPPPERDALAPALRARLHELGLLAVIRRAQRKVLAAGALVATVAIAMIAAVPAARHRVFPRDLADGKPWIASSAATGFSKAGVMTAPTRTEGLFHTNEEPFPSVTIDLGTVRTVRKVVVENRADCCRERALPLAIEVSADGAAWRRVAYGRADFRTWTATFRRARARFVRARVDRVSILHLGRIRVF